MIWFYDLENLEIQNDIMFSPRDNGGKERLYKQFKFVITLRVVNYFFNFLMSVSCCMVFRHLLLAFLSDFLN